MAKPEFNEDILSHSDVPEVEKRVYYTLTQSKELAAHRTAKMVGLLVKHLVESGSLSNEKADQFIRESVY